MRALFPRERRHCFAISPVKGQDTRGPGDPYLAPEEEAKGVPKCPAKIAAAGCFGYHRGEVIFLIVCDELLQTCKHSSV